MKFGISRRTLSLFMASMLMAAGTLAHAQDNFVSIGTGGVTGVYYPAGGSICRFLNKDRAEHGIRCSVESTGGSIYNINTIRSGELEFGIAQSDWQYHAFNGTDRFEEQGAFEDLRAVFSIHAEPFTLVARTDSGISSFEDVAGKRLNVGNPGSGTRANAEQVLAAFGLGLGDLALAGEMKGSEMSQALCDGKLDAMIYTIGHPAAAITEAASTCDVQLVEVAGPAIDALVGENPYFRSVIIPGGMYDGTNDDTATFGVGATLVSSAAVPDEVVYTLVKSVFDNLEDFRSLHPAFANLSEEQMIADGLSAPLHDGAVRYYKERGWM